MSYRYKKLYFDIDVVLKAEEIMLNWAQQSKHELDREKTE